jgi:murein DD-endopeptidase MepM/ murein hydrolase activator NlpD
VRAAAVIFISIAIVAAAAPATADHDGIPDPVVPLYPLTFPIVGEVHYTDTWHAPRSGDRVHLGTDIMADKMVPVVAVASGTVSWMHDEQGGNCCAMGLSHDDGWGSRYIHLNNDTPGTDDGLGWGFAPGIERGVHVDAGQLIGYVGDSGNAENSASHVHFELIAPDVGHTNPYPHLTEGLRIPTPFEGSDQPPCPEGATCDTLAFVKQSSAFYLHDQVRRSPVVNTFFYGDPGDVPLMGDWDCDGEATPAMYRSSNGFMYLRNSNSQGVADVDYFYGDASDIPLAGDFDGDGCDTLAIYRADEGRVYIKNSLGTGIADYSYYFGVPGDKPFVGDFDGDGIDTVGLHRESSGFVYFRDANTEGPAHFEFFYGNPGDRIAAGDWDGNGTDTVAVYRPSEGMLYVKLSNSQGNADYVIPVGDFSTALAVTAPPSAPKTAIELEECVFEAHAQGRVGLPLAANDALRDHARDAALAVAGGDASGDAGAAAEDAALAAVEAEMGISYTANHVIRSGEPSCDAVNAEGETFDALTVFVGVGAVVSGTGVERHAVTTIIEVRALPKADYESELGIPLTDAEYELLVTEGLAALSA